MQLADLYPPLRELLAGVETQVREVWEAEDGLLGRAAKRALSGPGKRLRPSILLLSAECAGRATERSIALAAAVELIHTASLVHDDILDGSGSRRGKLSANAEWGNKVSVLLGDYLVAEALELLPAGDTERFLPALVSVAKRMCHGQVEELARAGRPMSEAEYIEIVRAKTGSLFEFCGWAGAETSERTSEVTAALERFSGSFGVAFQLADDILDLVGSDGRSGKPPGRDLAQRKFTLPLILAAERGGVDTRAQLEMLLQQGAGAAEVRDLVEAAGAVEEAWGRVEAWLARARRALEVVPESDAKQALVASAGERFPMPVMAVDR